ncbi:MULTISPECIES: acyl carrier protein [unclassified Symbiopectobacterium]|uniref:acyl carrier protein n=1 Tax=unclassified Symbiopectobacterium TaxID=2794573 RepID=UPI002225C5A0|nr:MULTISPECIES: acyl carrier protein [unclassified Symbiopectobacterium]MCW2474849.1 acyl carrier protein [Candidatus Symbiopectobacterium sp. NZEC151]MCW2482378.1 acyl carrier protein [Candidatus Symbiopectobacterium sp. NZEC135]MCW2487423.1 acyl carrier protein [Candidatus Symbiopectobacterium sp. NZEC127]
MGSDNERQVKALIHQVSGIPVDSIGLNDSVIVTLGLDSVEMIDLLMQLEAFGVTIPSAQIDAALTVRNIVELFAGASYPERGQPTL